MLRGCGHARSSDRGTPRAQPLSILITPARNVVAEAPGDGSPIGPGGGGTSSWPPQGVARVMVSSFPTMQEDRGESHAHRSHPISPLPPYPSMAPQCWMRKGCWPPPACRPDLQLFPALPQRLPKRTTGLCLDSPPAPPSPSKKRHTPPSWGGCCFCPEGRSPSDRRLTWLPWCPHSGRMEAPWPAPPRPQLLHTGL